MFTVSWVAEYCDYCSSVVIQSHVMYCWLCDISLRFVQLKPSLVLAVFVLEWSFWRNFILQKWFMCPSLLGVRISELHGLHCVSNGIRLEIVKSIFLCCSFNDLYWIKAVNKVWVTCCLDLYTRNKPVTLWGNCINKYRLPRPKHQGLIKYMYLEL